MNENIFYNKLNEINKSLINLNVVIKKLNTSMEIFQKEQIKLLECISNNTKKETF